MFIKVFMTKWYIFILWKNFSRQIYSYSFCILKLNSLKVIHDLYSQCLTQTLFKTTFFSSMDEVYIYISIDFLTSSATAPLPLGVLYASDQNHLDSNSLHLLSSSTDLEVITWPLMQICICFHIFGRRFEHG